MSVTDLQLGIYRKIYSGFLLGKRINTVSLSAEAAFWRIHALADDFGNAPADPHVIKGLAFAKRPEVTAESIGRWVSELAQTGHGPLVRTYESDGEPYLHIIGFPELQPAGKNGKRVQRYPRESGGIQVNPDLPKSGPASHSHSHAHAHAHADPPPPPPDHVPAPGVRADPAADPAAAAVLTDAGVSKAKAAALAAQHPPEVMRAAIAHVRENSREARNGGKPPPGLIVNAVEDGTAAERVLAQRDRRVREWLRTAPGWSWLLANVTPQGETRAMTEAQAGALLRKRLPATVLEAAVAAMRGETARSNGARG